MLAKTLTIAGTDIEYNAPSSGALNTTSKSNHNDKISRRLSVSTGGSHAKDAATLPDGAITSRSDDPNMSKIISNFSSAISSSKPKPGQRDVAWLLSAVRMGAPLSLRSEGGKELKRLIKSADESFWHQNCAQVFELLYLKTILV